VPGQRHIQAVREREGDSGLVAGLAHIGKPDTARPLLQRGQRSGAPDASCGSARAEQREQGRSMRKLAGDRRKLRRSADERVPFGRKRMPDRRGGSRPALE